MSQEYSLEARLARLERRTRWLAAGCLLLGSMVLGDRFAVRASQSGGDVVAASAFHLLDESGRVVGELASGTDGPRLILRDGEGVERVRIVHEEEQSGLFVQDDRGDTRIGIAQFAHGGGGVALHGPEAKGAAVLYLKGQGTLSFYDADGKVSYRVPGSQN